MRNFLDVIYERPIPHSAQSSAQSEESRERKTSARHLNKPSISWRSSHLCRFGEISLIQTGCWDRKKTKQMMLLEGGKEALKSAYPLKVNMKMSADILGRLISYCNHTKSQNGCYCTNLHIAHCFVQNVMDLTSKVHQMEDSFKHLPTWSESK